MNVEQAIEKYGPIEGNVWAREGDFCSLLKIPPDIGDHWINSSTGNPTRNIYCNKDIQDALLRALQNVRDRGLLQELHTFDGCYMVRSVRGEPGKVSSHAYALSIDINAATNQLGTEGDLPPQLVECFTSEGFFWGGNFSRKDPMHFSFGW